MLVNEIDGEREDTARVTVKDDCGQISHEIWPLLQHSTKAEGCGQLSVPG